MWSFIHKTLNPTQSQLAFEAGIPLIQISRIERGIVNPTISTLSAKALDVELKERIDLNLEKE